MPDLLNIAAAALAQVRCERPLIHIITNFVTMNDVANTTLALGARPIMAHALEEVEEVACAARALVLNLGTPSRERVEAMLRAGQAANACAHPVVLDPVGVGASAFRRDAIWQLLGALRVTILRGNAGEIGTLAGVAGAQSGVDASGAQFEPLSLVRLLAIRQRAVVILTGATDFVSDGARQAAVDNGHPRLAEISGAGDMLDAAIGAAAAVEPDALLAAASALLWFGIAAEQAAQGARGNGSFRVALLDALNNLDPAAIQCGARCQWKSGGS